MPSSSDQIAGNRRRAAVLAAAAVVLVALVGAVVGLALGAAPVGLLAGAVLGGALVALAWWRGGDLAVSLTGARPADPVDHARLHNLVEGLCTTAGLPKPLVMVVDGDARNAFAAGRGPRHASIGVTAGALESLSRVELEGLLASLLSRIRSHEVVVSTLAVVLVGLPSVAVPPLARLLPAVAGPQRLPTADAAGVAITRYPPGLVAALERLEEGSTVVPAASRATLPLWVASPVGLPSPSHPPLEERIEALREL